MALAPYKKVICQVCSKPYYRITNTHLWGSHRVTMSEYRLRFPDAQIEDPLLSQHRADHLRGKTYEEIYGPEEATALKEVRSQAALEQFKDPDQRALRSLTGEGRLLTDEQKQKLRESTTKHGGTNYRERAFAHYGTQCMRCGAEPESLSDLHVHHIDGMHAEQAGNHELENLMVLCPKCHAKTHRAASGQMRGISRFEKGILYVLEGMRRDFGIDMNDENFSDTPLRFARAMSEILSGAYKTDEQVDEILGTAFPSGGFDEILVARGIEAVSLCPHHLLPVRYLISVAYLPGNGKVLGLSKLARLASVLAARPVLQEKMTMDIANAFIKKVQAKGAAVYVSGRHSCMWARGVKQDIDVRTSAMLGVFRDDRGAQQEVTALLGIGGTP